MTDESDAATAAAGDRLRPLAAEALINGCDCSALTFENTAELQARETPLGQERVLEAVEFATGIARSGYNLYVMGSPGVGKHRLLKGLLAEHAAAQPPPSDWCYVADFANPDRPNSLELPPGRGLELCRDMRQLVEDLLTALPSSFSQEACSQEKPTCQ